MIVSLNIPCQQTGLRVVYTWAPSLYFWFCCVCKMSGNFQIFRMYCLVQLCIFMLRFYCSLRWRDMKRYLVLSAFHSTELSVPASREKWTQRLNLHPLHESLQHVGMSSRIRWRVAFPDLRNLVCCQSILTNFVWHFLVCIKVGV
jgi:hypothetical protein